MKITVLLVVVLSSLFAIGHQYNFTNNPVCLTAPPQGTEIKNTFVVVLDQTMPWKYRERLMYLFKHISCVIPSTPLVMTVALMQTTNFTSATSGTSVQLQEHLIKNPNQTEMYTGFCERFRDQLNQMAVFKKDYLTQNVQYLVPIIPESELENCSMIDTFKAQLKNAEYFSEFHFNGILINSNWSEEKKRANNIIIDIPNINVIDPQMTSMTSAENIDYVVKTAGIVQQINNFFIREIGIRPTTSTTTDEPADSWETVVDETTTEEISTTESEATTAEEEEQITNTTTSIVKSYTDEPKIQEKFKKLEPKSDTLQAEDEWDIIRDYFWPLVILLSLIIVILFCTMIVVCIWCCGRGKKSKSSKSSSGSSSSKSHRNPDKEPLLTPKKKKPAIVMPAQQVPLKHDEIDEWNQIKPGSRENEGVSAEPVEEPVKPDYGEMKISERQLTDGNENEQGGQRVKRGYHKNQAPTGFSFE